ncbi:MAG: hypothetical protein QOE23_1928 [Pseudonocardiales bacterium]|jgi:uncharacterized membrane protein|nr:hypothetical protein [Pseudonocardiales bacterium]
MADFVASTDVTAPAAELFDYLSQVQNLPNYFDRMTSVTDNGDGTIATTADLGDRTVEGEAWFRGAVRYIMIGPATTRPT